MPESKNETRVPTKTGLAVARKKLKDLRRKEPSSKLIEIVEEITRDKPASNDGDVAARPTDVEV